MWYICSWKICTNDCFILNYSSVKEDYFRVFLLSSEDSWWVRGPMVSLSSWWCLRRFNLLRHIYVGFTNRSLCERLRYNPFNRTYILFTIVFLTWYDLTSYYIVLPISISALVFRLWIIWRRCFNLLRHIYVGFINMSFCEGLSYNPYNITSVLFTVVLLDWYDLASYSIVLAI